MITIYYPNTTQGFFIIDGWAFGPFSKTVLPCEQTINYRSLQDALIQGVGSIRHEKAVLNHQVEADIRCSFCYAATTLAPTSQYPDYSKVRYSAYYQANALYGWATHRATSRWTPSSSGWHTFVSLEEGVWVRRTVERSTQDNNVAIVSEITYKSVTFSGSTVIIVSSLKRWTLILGQQFDPGWAWNEKQSWETLYSTFQMACSRVNPHVSADTTKSYNFYSAYGGVVPTLAQIHAKIATDLSEIWLARDSYPHYREDGELAMFATEKVRAINLNMIELLRDLRKPAELIPNLKSIDLKGASSAYLQWKYGILPTISDLTCIYNALSEFRKSKGDRIVRHMVRGSNTSESGIIRNVVQSVKISLRSREDGLNQILNSLDSIGFALSAKDIWDLIPYSFVIDWFLSVEDYLRRLESRDRIDRYLFNFVVCSTKVACEKPFIMSGFPLACKGTIKTVYYHRRVTSQCPLPSLTSLNTQTMPFHHWLEASALLFSRGR